MEYLPLIAIGVSVVSLGLSIYTLFLQRSDKWPRLTVLAKHEPHTVSVGKGEGGMALSEKREVTCLYVSNPTEREITIENVQFVGSDGVIDIRPDKNLASVGSHKSGQIIIREVWTDGYFVVKDALGNRFKSNKV